AKASADECILWHMRLGHLNVKTMNKLVRHNPVRGLPTKSFNNDHTCTVCLKGKQHKASWIKREFRNARTPQQNGVAERRNRTLIEAARTMLADAKLPVTFWAEAVNTACSGNSNPTVSSSNPPADQMETLTVESPIPTVSSPVPTACLNDSPEPSSEARLISKRVANQEESPSLDNILSLTNRLKDILGVTTSSYEAIGVEADVSNMEITISASPTLTLRIHKDHPKSQIIGPVDTPIQTRHKSKENLRNFLILFKTQAGWKLYRKSSFNSKSRMSGLWVRPIGTKWVLKNKKDERGIIVRNKARLVAQGHTQEEGIDYDEVFAPVARIEAIILFLAYASFMGFTVYQMDVKSVFLYGTIDEEVYLMQPPRF
nr:hypothetical protein [Tanacetum cinerariifolium]